MYCGSCGTTVRAGVNFCPNCGARLAAAGTSYAGAPNPQMTVNQQLASLQMQLDNGTITSEEFYARRAQVLSQPGVVVPPPAPVDSGSIGWWFLGFFFPIVGLILFLVWKDDKPLSARRAGFGALTSVIAMIVIFGVYIWFLFSLLLWVVV